MKNLLALFPTKGSATVPTTGMVWWYRGDSVVMSSGNVSSLNNLYTGSGAAPSSSVNVGVGGSVTVASGDLNGQNTLIYNFPAQSSSGSTVYFDPNLPFTFTGVFKTPALTSGNYVRLVNVAGNTNANSLGIFVYNPSGTGVQLFLNTGNANEAQTIDVTSVYQNYTTFVITYNGSGFTTSSNFIITINGQQGSLTQTASGNEVSNDTFYGGNSGFLSPGQENGRMAETMFFTQSITTDQVTQINNYFEIRYGI